MASSHKRLSPITTYWYNTSMSAVATDAATISSTDRPSSRPGLEPVELQERPQSSVSTTVRPQLGSEKIQSSTTVESIGMDRQDSGYEGVRVSSERKSSSSPNASHRLIAVKKGRPAYTTSSSTPLTRSSTRRSKRSSPRNSISVSGRPILNSRHTTPVPDSRPSSRGVYPTYQYFQFPTLDSTADSNIDVETSASTTLSEAEHPTPPPATVHYWTSDSTRRLEYAAIDAASSGVKGFLIKLVPDCILPQSSRRPRFHEPDNDSDAGSVRRYRLALQEEKQADINTTERRPSLSRKGFLSRWNPFSRRTSSVR